MPTLHPIYDRMVSRQEKEKRLRQQALVIWLYGLSGSGKSTLALALERRLLTEGITAHLLDGDNIRSGLSRGLGFGDADRDENIRRVAEVAKLFLQAGVVPICSIITSLRSQRALARSIIGADDLLEVYVKASLETCMRRDPKHFYKKAQEAGMAPLIGRDTVFEAPLGGDPGLTLETESATPAESLEALYSAVLPRLKRPMPAGDPVMSHEVQIT